MDFREWTWTRERTTWLNDAIKKGDIERVVELLAEYPSLIDHRYSCKEALCLAAEEGHVAIVDQLIRARSTLIEKWDLGGALCCAAKGGHDTVVTYLLALDPRAANYHYKDMTALHYAAQGGHDKVVDLLLVAQPDLITATTQTVKLNALYFAAESGHKKVFARVLRERPELIDKASTGGTTVLHGAARNGRLFLVKKILALRPNMIDAEDHQGWNAFRCAVYNGHERVVEQMLAIRPDLAFGVSKNGITILHCAIENCSEELVVDLWRRNPWALHRGESPFGRAVALKKNNLIELFQWSLSIDEIANAFSRARGGGLDYRERYWSVLQRQWASLQTHLHSDVLDIVLAYLDLDFLFEQGLTQQQLEQRRRRRQQPKEPKDAWRERMCRFYWGALGNDDFL